MNVVWASAHLPDPGRGGGWAHEYELLRYASGRHDIVLVSGELGPSDSVPKPIADLGIEVIGVARPHRPMPRKAKFLWRLLIGSGPIGAWAAEPVVDALISAVADIVQAGAVDLVHIMPQEAAPVAAATTAPSALFLGDGFLVPLTRQLAQTTGGKDRLRFSLDLRNTRRWEQRWYGEANAVACVSPDDADAMTRAYGMAFEVIPVAIGDEWFAAPTVDRRSDLVTLVANLDFEPNVDAVVWFATEVWPLIGGQLPAARLRVVGRHPTADVMGAVGRAGGELLADVADVRPYYWETTVVVAPVRLGAGVKNKVLHAAACGAPQVGTSFAFEGTGAIGGEDVLVGDDVAGLAAATVDCLTNRARAGRRAARAVRLADAHRTIKAGAALEALWQRALTQRSPSEPSSRL